MSKFRHYKCDTCGKEVDVDNDLTHAFIDRCNLTKGCLGRLRFVEDKNVKDNILNYTTAVQSSIIGTKEDTSIPEYISPCSGTSNEITLAVKGLFMSASNAVVTLTEILTKEVEYVEYVYNITIPVSAISGKDNSAQQKILTFDETSDISIYINGQEYDSSLYTAENNIIRFNSPIIYATFGTSSIFVKILVFTAATEVIRTLSFDRNVPGLSTSAWSNVQDVKINNEFYSLFTCTDLTTIDLNTRLTIKSIKVDGVEYPTSESAIILAAEPFTIADRIFSRLIFASDLDTSTRHLRYEAPNKVKTLRVTSESLVDVFPAISIESVFSRDKEFAKSSLASGDDTAVNANLTKNNKFVLGPI